MSFRYIGSKTRLVDAIHDYVGAPNGGTFVDAFSGTGVVAETALKSGWPVLVNDHLTSSAIMSMARVLSKKQASFDLLGGYLNAIKEINNVEPYSGFIWREYSPESINHGHTERRYFTEYNARKIDGIRNHISNWSQTGLINKSEFYILIADLLGAANRVANTAGTYGCFLSKWQKQSLNCLKVFPRIIPMNTPEATMSNCDVLDIACKPNDTIYFDPPYTKRQYAAYYHILETIALGDEPKIEGVCGIRPWKHIASDYCYKVKAANAIEKLVSSTPARRVFLSYSTEAHVSLDTLSEALDGIGKVTCHQLANVGRYRPNRAASARSSTVGEVLFLIEKTAQERMITT